MERRGFASSATSGPMESPGLKAAARAAPVKAWSDICAAGTTPGMPPGRMTCTLPVVSSTRFTLASSMTVPGSGAPTSSRSPSSAPSPLSTPPLPPLLGPPGARDSRTLDSPLSARSTVARTTCPTANASCAVWSAARPRSWSPARPRSVPKSCTNTPYASTPVTTPCVVAPCTQSASVAITASSELMIMRLCVTVARPLA
mmetsp:Transcript_3691/g.8818  ORF Transcript_3691/g.8818 Transcript_3691/m.8818 type:complete len:201 (+) Transcript_3691:711-1313(+)